MKNKTIYQIRVICIFFWMTIVTPLAHSEGNDVECKDYWNVQAQWNEMEEVCALGVKQGNPIAQVASAMNLLNKNEKAKAEELLLQAAENGYDGAYYWLGASQTETSKALFYLTKADGGSGYGLQSLVAAANIYFHGEHVEKDFTKARTTFKKAILKMIENLNNGIPKPPGTWWENAKWWNATNAIFSYAPRYGFKVTQRDNIFILEEIGPLKNLTNKELYLMRLRK